MTPLYCSSMAHVVDRAWAFLFADPPYQVVSVRPDGVVIHRPSSRGIRGATYFVTCQPQGWPRRGDEPVTFIDEVNAKGEYYHDLDLKTNLWCVFHTEHAKAVASFADEGQAKEEADKRNRPGDK